MISGFFCPKKSGNPEKSGKLSCLLQGWPKVFSRSIASLRYLTGTILDIFRWQLTSCWRKEPLNQSFVGSLSISPTACTWVPRRQEDLAPFIDLSLFKSISVGPHFKMEMQVSARMSISKVFSIQGEQQTSSIYLPSLQFAYLSWGIWEPHVYLNDWFMWTQALQHHWFGPPEAPAYVGWIINFKLE